MGQFKPVQGVPWSDGVIANCRWGGILVSDLLKYVGLSTEGNAHVCFESYATLCQDDTYYGASIPIEKCLSGDSSVMLAYEVSPQCLGYVKIKANNYVR